MSKRIWRSVPTVRVDIGDGDWVEIKAKRLLADQQAIEQATVTGKIRAPQGGDVELGELALGASVSATILRMVVAWGGPGFCKQDHGEHSDRGTHYDPGQSPPEGEVTLCAPEPVEEVVAWMDDPTAQVILREINERNPVPRRDAGANPTSAGAASS